MSKKTPVESTNFQDLLNANYSQDPHFEFTLTWVEVAPVYQKILSRLARQVKHKGFRPGKVPAFLAEDLLDQEYLRQEVLRVLVPQAYQKAYQKQSLKAFAEPEIVVKEAPKNQTWVFQAYLPQKPVVKLPDYKKILSDAKKSWQKEIQAESKKASSQQLQNKKTATSVKSKLSSEELNQQSTDRALWRLLEQTKPKISPILVKRMATKELEKMVQQLQAQNLSLEDYLSRLGLKQEALGEQMMYQALQNLQMEFILDALMEAEKIKASDEETLAKLKEVMPEVKNKKAQEAQLKQKAVADYIKLLVQRKKLSAWLLSL